MAIHDADYLKERFSDLKTPIGSEFSDLIDSCINYTVSGVVGFYSLSAVNIAALSSFSILSGGNSDQWDSTYTTVKANSALWALAGSSMDIGVRSLTANWDSTYTTVQENSSFWGQGSFSTFTDYLSTNSVLLSSVTIIDSLRLNGGIEISGGGTTTTLYIEEGKVGINTETPNSALTVVGDISATGNIQGSLVFPLTSTPPSNTVNPVSWVNVVFDNQTYKMPLFL